MSIGFGTFLESFPNMVRKHIFVISDFQNFPHTEDVDLESGFALYLHYTRFCYRVLQLILDDETLGREDEYGHYMSLKLHETGLCKN